LLLEYRIILNFHLTIKIKKINGKWFKWFSPDDVLYPDSLEILVNEVSDLTFAQVIQFLIYAEVIDRPGVWGAESVLDVPDWAKQNGCWWEADLISD